MPHTGKPTFLSDFQKKSGFFLTWHSDPIIGFLVLALSIQPEHLRTRAACFKQKKLILYKIWKFWGLVGAEVKYFVESAIFGIANPCFPINFNALNRSNKD